MRNASTCLNLSVRRSWHSHLAMTQLARGTSRNDPQQNSGPTHLCRLLVPDPKLSVGNFHVQCGDVFILRCEYQDY